jgi:hypothetical protein
MHPDFDMPSPGSIKGRSSSITAAFIQAIIPVIEPSDAEVVQALAILGMAPGKCVCAYCGDPRTEWDHFRPLVAARRPTGYVTEIANLVPACGKCNQSKGGKHWREWMTGNAKRSPSTRGVKDLSERIARLAAYEAWKAPKRVDFEKLVGAELYQQHWAHWQELMSLMDKAQALAHSVREKAIESLEMQAKAVPV